MLVRVYGVVPDKSNKGKLGVLEGNPFAAATLTTPLLSGYTGTVVYVFTMNRLSVDDP